MASPDRPGFFSFATLQAPAQPEGAYQTAALLMKIEGWLTLVSAAITVLVGAIAVAVLLIAGALGGILGNFLPIPLGPIGQLGVAVIVIILIVAILVSVAVSLAFLYWISWIYAKWTVSDPRALQHLKIYAIVAIVLSGLGLLGGVAGASPSLLLDIAGLVIGIMMLVQANDTSVQQHFQGGFRPVPE